MTTIHPLTLTYFLEHYRKCERCQKGLAKKILYLQHLVELAKKEAK